MSKKIVLKVVLNGEKGKQKVMKTVAGTEGVDSLEVNAKEEKITVIGDADPVTLANKLRRKFGRSELLSVGPAKEPEKKPEEKKTDEKKPEEKTDEKKADEKKSDEKKGDEKKDKKKEEKKDEKKEEKKADQAKANPEPNVTYMYLPASCDRCSGYTLALNHENPNACCIL